MLCPCRYLPQDASLTNLIMAYKVIQSTVPASSLFAHKTIHTTVPSRSLYSKKTIQAIVPFHSFQSFLKGPEIIYQHARSKITCHRSISSSHHSSIFWKLQNIKLPAHQKILANSQQHDGKSLLDRYIFVKTLHNFYEDVPDGIILDTAYADSRPGDDFDPTVPVVLGLHDTPGNHHDLVPLLNIFAKMGCRTIAPTFPGHGNTLGLMAGFDDVFSQSTAEKATFVHDFLNDLGIERVDLVIGVGAACYPMLHLCVADVTSKLYRSMAFISPWPFQRPRYEPNQVLTRRIQYLWDRPFFRASARLLLPAYKVGEIKGTREKVTTAYTLCNLDLSEVGGLALAAASLNLPRVVVFGEIDYAVGKELYFDVLDRLGIPLHNVSVFKGRLDPPRLPGALVFPNGGNDLHLKQTGIISAFLFDLVTLFHPHIRI